MKKFFAAFVLFAAFITVRVSAQKPIDLKFNLATGESYDYNMDVDMSTKGDFGGQAIDVKNTMELGYHFTVLGDSAGWKKLSATISKIVMNVNAGGMNFSYDSDTPPDSTDMIGSMLGKVLGVMKGAEFGFTMNAKGEIGSVSGIDELMQRMQSDVSDASGMGAGIGNSFSEDNFRQNMQQTFGAYPGKPVKPGDTWTSTTSTSTSGMKLETTNIYTLESVSGNIANVKVDSKLATSSADTAVAGISGTSSGNLNFDIPTGIAIDGNTETNLDIKVNEQGQTTPMTTEIKMKLTGRKS